MIQTSNNIIKITKKYFNNEYYYGGVHVRVFSSLYRLLYNIAGIDFGANRPGE